jgi:hypothetical protein
MKKNLHTLCVFNGNSTLASRITSRKETGFTKSLFVLIALLLAAAPGILYSQNCSVNAGVKETICVENPLFLYGEKSGLFDGPAVITWSQISGPAATIVAPNSLQTQVTNLIGGSTYVFRISTTCEDGTLIYQDVTKIVNEVTQADAGTGFTACPGNNAGQLLANAPGSGETGTWSVIDPNNGVTIVSPNARNSFVNFSANGCGATTLRWTITSDVNTCRSYDEVVVINRGGDPTISAGPDQVLSNCYSTTQNTTLAASYGGCGIDGQNGVWSIISGPNVPTIANTGNRNTAVSNLIEGSYVFRWTVSGPCKSGYDEVIITVPAPTADITEANAGNSQFFCDKTTTTTVLNGNSPLYVNEQVSWTQIGGPTAGVNIQSPTLPVTVVSGLDGNSTYTFRYTIKNSVTGCESSSSVIIYYYPVAPSITVPGPVLVPCGITTAEIPFTAGGSGITQYRILSGPEVDGLEYPTGWTDAPTSPATVGGLTSRGTYQFQFRRYTAVSVDCNVAYADVSVIISISGIEANAGTDQVLACNVKQTILAGNDPVEQGLTPQCAVWSLVSGPASVVLTNINSPSLLVENLVPGTYIFQWCMGGGPACEPDSDTVTIIVSSQPLPR